MNVDRKEKKTKIKNGTGEMAIKMGQREMKKKRKDDKDNSKR